MELWRELHERALSFVGRNDSTFINAWANKLPRFTMQKCKCREFWKAWRAGHPPDFSSREAYFAWTVACHNAVNSKLGKKEWTVAEAKKVWYK